MSQRGPFQTRSARRGSPEHQSKPPGGTGLPSSGAAQCEAVVSGVPGGGEGWTPQVHSPLRPLQEMRNPEQVPQDIMGTYVHGASPESPGAPGLMG